MGYINGVSGHPLVLLRPRLGDVRWGLGAYLFWLCGSYTSKKLPRIPCSKQKSTSLEVVCLSTLSVISTHLLSIKTIYGYIELFTLVQLEGLFVPVGWFVLVLACVFDLASGRGSYFHG